MQTSNGKVAHFVAGGVVVGGLPLLAFIFLFFQMARALNAGHPYSGDAIGLAIMSVFSFGLALLSLLIGVAYFGYQRKRHQLRPKLGHLIALAWVATELFFPIFYFAFF
ncbi:hypothetical protein HH213_29330 [Duganella dendranthematis]|uniref:Transmembrane protein n=1 Tax=Duganella dendranthematis TaxID=2728021 RepID=A0ABX6MHL1_9BURK|nr:hypothetical protein [Duganella dendranthematis]QJD93830.1 hypothetical protein HH213_29330 [Duganella dendranthematis]